VGGLVLDLYVLYLIKLVIWALRMRGSGKWPITTALVSFTDEYAAGSIYPTGTLVYSYDVDGETFDGENSKPFLWSTSAQQYIARFPEKSRITIRLKPGDPKTSVFRDDDQSASA
jgi:hypothetical protein